VHTDLDLFDELVARADTCGDAGALWLLDRASALASTDLLASPDETPWAEPVRADYRQRAIRAALRAAELALLDGAADTAIRLARRALSLDSLCEAAWRRVILGYLAAGRRDAALRAYRSCRRLLARDLGIAPAPETRAVLVNVVRGERDGRSDGDTADLGAVVDAAVALFEHGQSGERPEQVDDAMEIIAGLLNRVTLAGRPPSRTA
jgi:DNA-binding SARP family transcriptional activator